MVFWKLIEKIDVGTGSLFQRQEGSNNKENQKKATYPKQTEVDP